MNLSAIGGIIFGVFCLWLLRHAILNLRKADTSSGWPKVSGKMIKVELWGNRNIDGESKPVEKLNVEYEYEVDGKHFSGTNVAFYTLVYPETVEFANNHPEGSQVSVFYQPEDPSKSVLLQGAKGGNKRYSEVIMAIIGLIVSIGITLGGILGLIG